MADPRFYDNSGPYTLAEICAEIQAQIPVGADGHAQVEDLASLAGAGSSHLSFFTSAPGTREELTKSRAGFSFVPERAARPFDVPAGCVAIACGSVIHAFAAAARLFYPESSLVAWSQQTAVDPTAGIGERVVLGPGVVIGPRAEIGDGTRIAPNTVIGRGVAIGKD